MHPRLARQLRKLGLDAHTPPDAVQWGAILDGVGKTFEEEDQAQRLIDRSMAIASRELAERVESERTMVQSLEVRVRERTQALERAVSRLAASETRFRELTQMSSDWWWEQDAELRFVEMSNVPVYGGISGAAHIGKTRWDVPGTSIAGGDWAEHKAALAARQPFKHLLLLRDADDGLHFVSVSGNPMFEADGRFTGYRGIASDVTEKMRAEAMLRDSEQRLRALLDGIPSHVWMRDAQGRYVAFNRGAERALGLPAERILGRTVAEVCTAEYAALIAVEDKQVMDKGSAMQFEHRSPVDGIWYEVVRAPIKTSDGAFAGMISISRDISERKQMEEERHTRDREQRRVFVREIHHRIKNHVQGVAGLLMGHARREPALAFPIKNAIAQLQAVAVVHGLQGAAEGTPLLADMVEAICAAQQDTSPCAVRVNVQAHPGSGVRATINEDEAVPVALVINEIVLNAIKHMRRVAPVSQVTVDVEDVAGGVQIRVTNDGRLEQLTGKPNAARGGSGLRIVRSLLPARGAEFELRAVDNTVVARLTLRPPVIAMMESTNAHDAPRAAGSASC